MIKYLLARGVWQFIYFTSSCQKRAALARISNAMRTIYGVSRCARTAVPFVTVLSHRGQKKGPLSTKAFFRRFLVKKGFYTEGSFLRF
jgi:hypothetical protein